MRVVLAWVTTCWAVVVSLAPLLQVRLVVRHRDSSGSSAGWPATIFIGSSLWALYGLVTDDLPLIIADSIGALISLFTVIMIQIYRPARRAADQPVP
ncbi:SemiSWEET family transporter [Actinoplanes sp. NPDC051851]|uniref:SemiSWEET family sugar transporter n=1 Tax=Actinoplanes sp. NPDC051851 TaxID=3154753 RepID=UPI00342E162B